MGRSVKILKGACINTSSFPASFVIVFYLEKRTRSNYSWPSLFADTLTSDRKKSLVVVILIRVSGSIQIQLQIILTDIWQESFRTIYIYATSSNSGNFSKEEENQMEEYYYRGRAI